jgi:ribose/xylose/arabinose/galactoside ABC-type transport system permease subunit
MAKIPVRRMKIWIYMLGGFFAGMAGIMQYARQRQGSPAADIGLELDVIAAVFIGGASISGGYGSIFGSLVGAVMMTMLANGCTKMDWPNSRQEIATGVIIIIAVALDRLRHPPEVKG